MRVERVSEMPEENEMVSSSETPNKCRTCEFSWRTSYRPNENPIWACNYIVQKGKRRPCPYGEGCTVYERRTERNYDEWFK